jgi:anthranilate synthase component 2
MRIQFYLLNLCKNKDLKILLIDNYDSFTYNIVELLRQLNYPNPTILKNDEISIEHASEFDKIIISPGPATPSASGNIIDIIRALAPTHAILGICLGHQAIAESLGAQLINLAHPYHGYQTEIKLCQTHYLFDGICDSTSSMTVGLYHSWVVDEINFPAELEITSRSTENYIMSFKHKIYDVHGIQFHPESYMTLHGKELLANWLK